MKQEEKTLKKKYVYKGKIVNVRADDAETQTGRKVLREVVEHPGGVCVAALTEQDELLFVRQFRYPYGKAILELPAGKLEQGEDPFEAMKREQQEETGTQADRYVDLGELYPSPGYADEVLRLWACRVTAYGDTNPDEMCIRDRSASAQMGRNGSARPKKLQWVRRKSIRVRPSG